MKKHAVAMLCMCACLVMPLTAARADEDTASPGNGSISGDAEMLSKRLDKISASQAEILKELAEIKAELQIVKIRASERT